LINLKIIGHPKYFLVLWCVLGLWIVWQIGTAATHSVSLPGHAQRALAQHKSSSKDQTSEQPPQQASVPKNPFSPPPQFVSVQCTAILGQEALIEGRWYKIGDTVKGLKIVEIQPASVKIAWQDQEHILIPFNVPVQYSSSSPSSRSSSPPVQNPNNTSSRPPEPTDRRQPNIRGGPPPGAGMPSEEQRRQMRERYLNASPEEQAEMRRQMRDRFGGRRRRRSE